MSVTTAIIPDHSVSRNRAMGHLRQCRAAILILEKGRRMARELLCADAGRSIQTHHPVPVFAAHPGAAAGKELDRGGRA